MKSTTLNIKEILEKISHFIWNFKTGDNICYNLKILDSLYEQKEKTGSLIFNKPIAIFLVSIIEAMLLDLIERIDDGTNDLPAISQTSITNIKNLVAKHKTPITINDPITGVHTFNKRKNYKMKEVLTIFEDNELIGSKGDSIYKRLEIFNRLRNRVHILNYFKNFHVDENKVFENDIAIEDLSKTLVEIVDILDSKYYRNNLFFKTMESNYKTWLAKF